MPVRILVPDRYLTSVLQIKTDWLRSEGIEALLIDIDNTMVSRDTQKVSDEVREWARSLSTEGFKLYLVTNNWHRTVFETAAELQLPVAYRSMKPLPFNFLRALRRMGVKRHQAIVVGDQMMTDILGSKLIGMRSIMVLPLTETDLAHTKFLRKVEKILLAGSQPEAFENADPFKPNNPPAQADG